MPIHPTAIVDPTAKIAESAEIGPYCVIGANVEIGARTVVKAHVMMEGPLAIGEDNVFFPYSTVGVAPQDLKYHGERSCTRIGHRNKIREFVTIHRGTESGGMVTTIGDDNLLMVQVHVAHDVRVGSHCVLSHAATVGGHVALEDWSVVGAGSAIHQFCRIGRHSMIGGYSVVTQDVLPFSTTSAKREVKVYGENKNGLERRGFSAESMEALHKAFRLLSRSKLNTSQALEKIQAEVGGMPEVDELLQFIAASTRGFIK
ncbi:MAG: acyl-ACP--UDP-N-acetylglucosamine O-acyltransferase [Acidobacteriota bacterium]|nr:acyl-ACP--UDP-N-acetylglucosamine O-acyltransferase [Acidobacteriota bacterium]